MKDCITSSGLSLKQAKFILANKKMFSADKVAAAREVVLASELPALRRIMQTMPPARK